MERKEDVALLIDWDNLKIGLERLHLEPNISELYEASQEYGRVVVARAYADWLEGGVAKDPPALYQAGVTPVYVPKRRYVERGPGGKQGVTIKNSVDVRMATDATTLCHTNPNVETYVLVTGDQDFLHVVNALRPYGRKVVLVGVSGSLSQTLADFVDQVIYYDRDIEEPPAKRMRRRRATKKKEGEGEPSLLRLYGDVEGILKGADPPGVASFSYISNELNKKDPNFTPKAFGFKRFRNLMQDAQERGVIAGIRTRRFQHWAYLKGSEKALEKVLNESS
jgi:uncharacterized LabA/DUF88 family protein